jgi:hypothetical protein
MTVNGQTFKQSFRVERPGANPSASPMGSPEEGGRIRNR